MSDKPATFRSLILDAAREADLEFRDRVQLRIVLRRNPERIAKELLEQAKAEGVVPQNVGLDSVADTSNTQGRDWEAFFKAFGKFIADVLPLILKALI